MVLILADTFGTALYTCLVLQTLSSQLVDLSEINGAQIYITLMSSQNLGRGRSYSIISTIFQLQSRGCLIYDLLSAHHTMLRTAGWAGVPA